MADFNHIQRDFSGGELSLRMLMRADTDVYKRSAAVMDNYWPTPMGSALRVPGTVFVRDLSTLDARIIPYLTFNNEKALLIFTDTSVRLIRNIVDILDPGNVGWTPGDPDQIKFRKEIIEDAYFTKKMTNWTLSHDEIEVDGGSIGIFWRPTSEYDGGQMVMRPLIGYPPGGPITVTSETSAVVDVATDVALISYEIAYTSNPGDGTGAFLYTVEVSTDPTFADNAQRLYRETYNENNYQIGDSFVADAEPVTLPTADWTGTLYLRLTATAEQLPDDETSNPSFRVFYCSLKANGEALVQEQDIVSPYTADELNDLHFVQSPYDDKELVITHPKHPPQEFLFDTGGGDYVLRDKVFNNPPGEWGVNNYPATCTAYLGRLVLAGALGEKVTGGDPAAGQTETVWATKVADWNSFSAPEEVNPDDSIEFRTIYRSPINWVHGHKNLLIGAREMEYIASADGIFAPNDLGVELHSTHGSNRVQPAAFGEGVMFASDGGTKVRAMTYQNDSQGWVAPDMTVYNPDIIWPRIRRMVRVRNPHQMCWCVNEKGNIAVLHAENNISGWSNYTVNNGQVRDICTLVDNEGLDAVFMLVERKLPAGGKSLYLEVMPQNQINFHEVYTTSTIQYEEEIQTSTLTGLDHLEGQLVQVYTKRRYLGFYEVLNGEIDITPNLVRRVNVGLMQKCRLTTLPPETLDPGSAKRYATFSVRTFGSTRPVINGYRTPDRDPAANMGNSQPLDWWTDIKVAKAGWDPYQMIEIHEQIPLRSEILGVYGALKANSVAGGRG